MIQIDFHYEGSIIPLQYQKEEIMENIFINFCKKASINNIKSVFFLYDGKIIDNKFSLGKIINLEDKKQNKINILVYSRIDKNMIENNSSAKAKPTICPKCGENAKIKFTGYLIKIYGCKNDHITENIPLEQYGKTQIIDEEKIICCFCKKRNKEKSFNKIFYFCGTCKQNLCPICKDYHSKNHNIINYDLKNYTCSEHGDNYNSYCKKCKINICIACENYHLNHDLILFGKLIPKKEDLNDKVKELNNKVKKFKEEINELKNILNYVIENVDNYYNIINNIYSSFELKKRNYEILSNINEMNNNDKYLDFQEIINENNIVNKFYKIIIIYYKIKNDYNEYKNYNIYSNNYFINDMNFLTSSQRLLFINLIKNEFNELLKFDFPFGSYGDIYFKLLPLADINNPYEWRFSLRAPFYSPYSGGLFYLKINFPFDYPNKAPEFRFVTPFYHLNVNHIAQPGCPLGHIWATWLNFWHRRQLKDAIIGIFGFFCEVCPDNPFEIERQQLYINNIDLFNKRVKYFTKKYADPSLPYKEYNSWDFSVPDELEKKI